MSAIMRLPSGPDPAAPQVTVTTPPGVSQPSQGSGNRADLTAFFGPPS
jgi:hypothetical protein